MKKVLLILLITLFSCGTAKNKKEKVTDTVTSTSSIEKGEIISSRPGDTLTYTVLNPVLKDTILYITNTEKAYSNTLRIKYDESGLQTIDCISQEIDELKKYIIELEQNKTETITEKEKVKETTFKPIMILWIFIGIAVLIIIVRLAKKVGL